MGLVFETAAALTNIILIQKAPNERKTRMVRVRDDFNAGKDGLPAYVNTNASVQNKLDGNSWVAYTETEYRLKRRVEEQGVQLRKWDVKINRGILTGYNEAFIIDQAKRDELVAADPKSAEIIRPILRGRDVRAWVPSWDNWYLIGTFPALKLDIDDYPAIRDYLGEIQERLEPKPRKHVGKWNGRKSGSYRWFETQDSIAYHADFDKPKIIYPNMTNSLPFAYDRTEHWLTNQKCFIISGKSLGYLTAIFNSPLYRFCFKDVYPELMGNTYELSKVFFEKVPIKKPDPATEWIFERLADCIIKAKRSEDHKMAGLFFQYLVNGLVYELYFGSAFKKAGIQLLTLLNDDNLPELPEGKAGLKKLVQVFEHLHDKQHSIRIGLFKLDTVREVRIIEGKEK